MAESINIPPIRLVEIKNEAIASSNPVLPAPPTDLRQTRVEEFFHSRQLADNTQRSYQQQFDRFLGWTDKAWQEINHRDILRYKGYLEQQGYLPHRSHWRWCEWGLGAIRFSSVIPRECSNKLLLRCICRRSGKQTAKTTPSKA